MYDIIGDIHGYASLLKKMLLELGYKKTSSGYSHPERKAVFVGDFINRGPQIRKALRIIRTMTENQNALAVLGNHEINLIINYLKNKNRSEPKNDISEIKTYDEFKNFQSEWKGHIKWLRSLPLFLELDGIRIVHACWSDQAVNYVKENIPPGIIKKAVFREIDKFPESPLAKNVWMLTKGPLFSMPGDLKITSSKGISPRSFRMRWWENPMGKTFNEILFENNYQLPEYTIPPQITPGQQAYPEESPTVFFGHYCMAKGPHIIRPNICCIDACINGSKSLLAYRWDRETVLSELKLVRVRK